MFLMRLPFAKLMLLTSSEALEAKGVITNATKNAGIREALLKDETASTIGSATSATTCNVCVCVRERERERERKRMCVCAYICRRRAFKYLQYVCV